jgi:bla regulator protein BlaR1
MTMRIFNAGKMLVIFLFILSGCAAATATPTTARIVDDIDLPFVDDPEIIGKWETVDFVETVEQFDPENIQMERSLALRKMTFREGGTTSMARWTWTKGVIISLNDETASQYLIKEIEGTTYLFFEWKCGDYTLRQQKPWFYVLKKV